MKRDKEKERKKKGEFENKTDIQTDRKKTGQEQTKETTRDR